MAKTNADRNLLYGILALQLGFIDRDALVDAMRAWVIEKDKPIGQILLDRGRLTTEEWPLLEALVSVHLRRHGGDLERSLDDLSSLGSVRAVLERLGDTDLTSSLAGTATRGYGESTTTASTGSSPEIGGARPAGPRFRVVRPHARGGLGEVFLALDAELNRVVALKQLQDRHADDPRSQARFLVEAEITGGLEHPGIVPVYGLGTYDGGRPFYAMRFIRGDSLLDAIRRFHAADRQSDREPGERSLERRQLLGRFIDVCDAMAYAHSRGVLHRDLKPGNIMLGKYGETLVVDWGLAKPMNEPTTEPASETDNDEEPALRPRSGSGLIETAAGSVCGTPQYMSPEQTAGGALGLGAASDVYSLGATLYCLLTGRSPFGGDEVAVLLAKVARGEFPPPRAIKPDTPAALEAVCLKAMSLAADARYAAPRLLAEDIERWLADEPVSARREPWPERARRWARRHRGLVTGTAVALVVALLALGGFLAREAQANRQLRLAHARETHAREQAQARFALARDAVAHYYRGVSEDVLLRRTEFRDLRRSLLKSAPEFYQKLTTALEADPEADSAAHLDLARASRDLAGITREIGSAADALKSALQAQVLYAQLVRQQPEDAVLARERAGVLKLIGFLHSELGHPGDALHAFQDELAIRQALVQHHPDSAADRNALAGIHGNIGNLLDDTGRQSEALRAYHDALAILESLVADHPNDITYESELARVLRNLSQAQDETGHPDDALRTYEQSLAILRRLAQAHPDEEGLQGDLAGSYTGLGHLCADTGRPTQALDAYEKSRDINRKLVAAHPNSTIARRHLANNYNDIGNVHGRARRLDEAIGPFRQARAIQEALVVDNPDRLQYQNDLATSLTNIGIVHTKRGQTAEALPLYEQSLVIRQKLAAANPADTNAMSKLAWTHQTIGVLLSRSGRHAEALGAHEQARAIRQSMADQHPDLIPFRAELARDLLAVGFEHGELGHWDEALRCLEQARELLDALARTEPKIALHRRLLAESWTFTGLVHRRAGRAAQALKPYALARALLEVLVRDDPDDLLSRSHLGQSWTNASFALVQLGRFEEAVTAARAAIAQQRVAVERSPQVIEFRKELGRAYVNLSEALLALRRPDEAASAAREVRQLWPRDPEELYKAARLLASCGAENEAIEALHQAVAAGLRNARRLANDPAFAPWRDRPDFQTIVMEMMDRDLPSDPFR